MKIYELKCTAFLKQDITYKNSYDILSSYINFSFLGDEELKELHEKKGFKNYSFGNFYPPSKDKIYKNGNTYTFNIRSFNESFIDKLSKLLRENINNKYFQVVQANKKVINRFFINELITLTPTIVTIKKEDGKYDFWTTKKDGDILKLQKQLQDNLLKKYEDVFNEKLEPIQNFIQLMELKNHTPQSIYFRKKINDKKQINVRLLGNKFRLLINEDEVSQKLAFTALACSLGEKSSLGGGFCICN